MTAEKTKTMSLATRLRLIHLEIGEFERKSSLRQQLLDVGLEMHNSLTDWAANTTHAQAAEEVMAILDAHTQSAKAVADRHKLPGSKNVPSHL